MQLVRAVVATLAEAGCETWVFGGWAEEINGVCPPREHRDIDLLLPAQGFDRLDTLFADRVFSEIATKRFPHKRALEYDGVMVELFLVQRDPLGPHTNSWGCARHDWPPDTVDDRLGLRVATREALCGYRARHRYLHEPRAHWLARQHNADDVPTLWANTAEAPSFPAPAHGARTAVCQRAMGEIPALGRLRPRTVAAEETPTL